MEPGWFGKGTFGFFGCVDGWMDGWMDGCGCPGFLLIFACFVWGGGHCFLLEVPSKV